MNLSPTVGQQIAAIKSDNTHGASWLARAALRIAGACAREPVDGGTADLVDRVRVCALALIDVRPEMAPIRFWVERLLREVDEAAIGTSDVDVLRDTILRGVARLVEESEQAGQRVVENADERQAANLVIQIAERLIARHETVAIAESGTGGRICDLLTDRPGSSAWFAGGVVAYSNASKRAIIGATTRVIEEFGAVSPETAQALAEGAARQFGSAWGIGETGIAGPQTGRRSSKPAGLAFVAVHGPDGRRRAVEVQTGLDDRLANKRAFAIAALAALLNELSAVGNGRRS